VFLAAEWDIRHSKNHSLKMTKKPISKTALTAWLKSRAATLGFAHCGIARAGFLEAEARHLEQWLKSGMNGQMKYMERYFEKRVDPRKLLDNARSVIVFLYNYFPKKILPESGNYVISKYAYGEDYHFVIKDKLYNLVDELRVLAGDINARPFVDSAPALERAWAEKAGLGWIGKNANLIVPKQGSFFFIALIITDLELVYDQPKSNDFCSDCRRCLIACPTQAIVAPRVVDARKCISYLTIEMKNEISAEFAGQFNDRIFGCDICQDVCPWSRFSVHHNEPRFDPHSLLKVMKKTDWENLTQSLFNEIFRKSAIKRAKYTGLARNIAFAKKKSPASY
jgi:epoxyqueuosine reductase